MSTGEVRLDDGAPSAGGGRRWSGRLSGAFALRRPQGPAERRVLRVIGFGFLPSAVVFGLLDVGPIATQWESFPPTWTMVVLAGVVGSALLLGALSFRAPLDLLRALGATSALCALAAQATESLVVLDWPDPEQSAWVQQLMSLGAIASVVAWRLPASLAVTTAIAAFTAVDRVALDGVDDLVLGVQDGLYVLLFSATFLVLGGNLFSGARRADAAQQEASRTAAEGAADAARERELARVNALVHDRVLATLLAAARGGAETDALVRADAERALSELHALLEPEEPGRSLSGEALAFALQGATTELDPEATFAYEVHSDRSVPGDVVDALTAGLEEALRNAARHAEAPNRSVHVSVGEDLIRIDVLDDGVGFDPAAVSADRLGIGRSILGRMRAVSGGGGEVVSATGTGTRITLSFRFPPG
jgi:signal transduction histidine kinase